MKHELHLSVVIPAWNEAKTLPSTLITIDKYLSAQDFDYEILVVSDGSTDETVDVVKRLANIIHGLRVIDNKENHGKGAVVRQGMLEAKGAIRLFMDADNATTIDHFEKMKPFFDETGKKYDIVIGSRDIPGAKMDPPQPWWKNFLGNAGNLFIRILLIPGVKDTQCGFKAMTAEAAEKIFKYTKIDRWSFDVEILALGKKLGFKTKEIPVHWISKPVSRVKISAYFRTLFEVIKIKWWIMTNKYGIKKSVLK